MPGLRVVWTSGLAIALLFGCTDAGEPLGVASEPLIYGSDNRREPFTAAAAHAETARASVLAVIPPSALDFANAPELAVRAAPLSAWDDFCPGERFLGQPTAARCAAVLIDDDVALTAAHCLEGPDGCRGQTFVFDYLYPSSDVPLALTRESVFGCRAVVTEMTSPIDSDELYDYAIVQLDRAATANGRAAVAVRAPGPVRADEPLSVLGFPLGLPLKLDEGALAGDPRDPTLDAFTLAADTYDSSSGSPVLDARGTLAGVMTRGLSDFVDRGDCRESRVVDDTERGETAGYAFRAVEALCGSGWPSERLCGNRTQCGDGICSNGETPTTCSVDCTEPECGDLLCEASEWENCPEDCGDRRPANVPNGWYCLSEWYDDGETCDCGCGDADPDCTDERACDSVGPGGRELDLPRAASRRVSSRGCSVGSGPLPSGNGLLLVIAVAMCAVSRRVARGAAGTDRLAPSAHASKC